jgi:hypothetical protein
MRVVTASHWGDSTLRAEGQKRSQAITAPRPAARPVAEPLALPRAFGAAVPCGLQGLVQPIKRRKNQHEPSPPRRWRPHSQTVHGIGAAPGSIPF